jgi:hypothetical protein
MWYEQLKTWGTQNPRPVWGIVIFVGLLIGQLAIQHGALYFPDEHRYFWNSHSALLLLLGKIAPSQRLPIWQEGLSVIAWHLQLLPVAWLNFALHGVNPITDWLGGVWVDRSWLWPYSMVNVGCYIATVILMGRIAHQITRHTATKWLVIGLTLLWPPLWLWMRHVVPYPLALVWTLLSIWLLLQGQSSIIHEPKRWTWILASGGAFAVGFFTYPGFYYVGLVHALILLQALGRDGFKHWKPELVSIVLWWVPFIGLLLAIDAVSRSVFGLPYLQYWHQYLPTMVQGDFAEGLALTWRYQTQTMFGATAVGVITLGTYSWCRRRGWQYPPGLGLLGTLVAWLAMATLLGVISTGLHQTVIYGRTLLPLTLTWLMLVGLILGQFVQQSRAGYRRVGMVLTIVLGGMLGWSGIQTLAVSYPMDLIMGPMGAIRGVKTQPINQLYLHGGKVPDGGVATQPFEKGHVALLDIKTTLQGPGHHKPIDCGDLQPVLQHHQSVYLAVNRGYMYPLGRWIGLGPNLSNPRLSRMVVTQPHPMNSPWYQFEGFTPDERQQIRQHPVMMQLMVEPCQNK